MLAAILQFWHENSNIIFEHCNVRQVAVIGVISTDDNECRQWVNINHVVVVETIMSIRVVLDDYPFISVEVVKLGSCVVFQITNTVFVDFTGADGRLRRKKRGVGAGEWRRENDISVLSSDQARLPAEFKHITKRRKRN